jgi:hypothetical protein
VRYLRGDAAHIVQGAREIGNASCLCRQSFQRRSGPICLIFLRVEQQADRVDHRAAQALHTANGLLQTKARCIVRAIRNYQQHLFGQFAVVRQFICRRRDSIVKRGGSS